MPSERRRRIPRPTRGLRTRRGATALLLLLPAMAGCLGGLDLVGTEALQAPLGPPTWSTADWWRYHVEGALPAPWMEAGFHDRQAGPDIYRPRVDLDTTTTLVATPVSPGVFVVHTDDRTVALAGPAFPLTGHWDMAERHRGTGNGTRMEAVGGRLDWPLEDGKEWTHAVGGTPLELSAHRNGTSYEVVGTLVDGGTAVLRLAYDPSVRWVTDLVVMDAEGATVFTAVLADQGTSFDGLLFNVHVATVLDCFSPDNGSPMDAGSCLHGSNIGDDRLETLFIDLAYKSSEPGVIRGTEKGPGDLVGTTWVQETCPCDAREGVIMHDPEPGNYEHEVNYVGAGDWFFSLVTYHACLNAFRVAPDESVQVVDQCPFLSS